MGNLRAKSWGYRHGTRNKFSKRYKTKGIPGTSRYLTTFKRGDYVDVALQSGLVDAMPISVSGFPGSSDPLLIVQVRQVRIRPVGERGPSLHTVAAGILHALRF